MNKQDILQRFIFEHAPIRGEITRINNTYLSIINQRPYPPLIKKFIGEALVSCLLLIGSLKFEGELTIQFQGDSRLPLLLVQCDHFLNMRALAKYQQDIDEPYYQEAFLKGTMALTLNPYDKTQTYQSIVPIFSTQMSDNLMQYFAQSEQISTQICLAVSDTGAAGMLLQLMPTEKKEQKEQFWEYAVCLGQTLKPEELLSLDNIEILHRLYHETEIRLFESRTTRFKCRCSPDKMKQVIVTLGEEDAKKLLKEQGKIEITCDFCNKQYNFDTIDIALIFPG